MEEPKRKRRQEAIGEVVERSGLVETLGNKVLRAAGGLGDLAGEARKRAVDAIGGAVRRRIASELDAVFEDDDRLCECARWFESPAAALFRETAERLADTASPFALLDEALHDPLIPSRFRELQRARPVVVLDSRRGPRRTRTS